MCKLKEYNLLLDQMDADLLSAKYNNRELLALVQIHATKLGNQTNEILNVLMTQADTFHQINLSITKLKNKIST